jgi:hypothetical protein
MNTEGVAGTTASVAIASDLALHFLNFGLPGLGDLSPSNNGFLNLTGTVVGVATTATTSGVASDDLKTVIDAMPSPKDRMVARASVASAFLSAKTLAQSSTVFLASFVVPDGRKALMDYVGFQLAPSLVLNAITAFVVPYTFSN